MVTEFQVFVLTLTSGGNFYETFFSSSLTKELNKLVCLFFAEFLSLEQYIYEGKPKDPIDNTSFFLLMIGQNKLEC